MDRRQFEYFVGIVDHGSFTAAAQALHVSQPSVSQMGTSR
jgi:DNA-binding transcriptional LysR family regulator